MNIPKQMPRRHPQDRRQNISAEKKVEILRRRVRVLSWLLTLAIALTICLGALTISLLQKEEDGPAIGQNYSSAVPKEERNGQR